MSAVLEIRCKQYTYDLAQGEEYDVMREVKEARKTSMLRDSLLGCKHEIELLTSHHLGLSKGQCCHMLDQQEWIYGRFNVCIPVIMDGTDGRHGSVRPASCNLCTLAFVDYRQRDPLSR